MPDDLRRSFEHLAFRDPRLKDFAAAQRKRVEAGESAMLVLQSSLGTINKWLGPMSEAIDPVLQTVAASDAMTYYLTFLLEASF